ncbi:MAG: outer membrane beta-barrel protein [Flavobacteriales bacterium]|nr:outer membrane beta-barrel protein [Flavobacteriales bacterium]
MVTRIVVFALLVSTLGWSQFRNDAPIKFGTSISVNYFSLMGDEVLESAHKPSLGTTIGAGLSFLIIKDTFFNLGVYYSNNQTKYYGEFTDLYSGKIGRRKITHNFYYVHFPFLIQRYFDNRFYLKLGPQVSLLNNVKLSNYESVHTLPPNLESNRTELFVNAAVGRSFAYDAGNELYLELANQFGVFNTGSPNFPRYNANTILFTVGWYFYL